MRSIISKSILACGLLMWGTLGYTGCQPAPGAFCIPQPGSDSMTYNPTCTLKCTGPIKNLGTPVITVDGDTFVCVNSSPGDYKWQQKPDQDGVVQCQSTREY